MIAVLFVRGPRWDASVPLGEQAGVPDHIEWVHAHRDRPGGPIIEAGPFHDPRNVVEGDHVGLALLDVGTLEEAQALVEGDPVIARGTYAYHLFEWGGEPLRR